jgi:RNA polymerase sigma-70 factor, ECF subfamily
VVNASLDLLRRRSARAVAWSGDPDELPVPEPRQVMDSASGTDTRMDVDAALHTLPPPLRAALVLVDMLGHSVADAAVILGVPEGTVKSRCARGRARLLPHLSHLRDGSPPGRNRPVADGVSVEQGGGV